MENLNKITFAAALLLLALLMSVCPGKGLHAQMITEEEVTAVIESVDVQEVFQGCAATRPHPDSVELSFIVSSQGQATLLLTSPPVDKDLLDCFKAASKRVVFKATGNKFEITLPMEFPPQLGTVSDELVKSVMESLAVKQSFQDCASSKQHPEWVKLSFLIDAKGRAELFISKPEIDIQLFSCFEKSSKNIMFKPTGYKFVISYDMQLPPPVVIKSKGEVTSVMESDYVKNAFLECAASGPHPESVEFSFSVDMYGKATLLSTIPLVDKTLFDCFQAASNKATFKTKDSSFNFSYPIKFPASIGIMPKKDISPVLEAAATRQAFDACAAKAQHPEYIEFSFSVSEAGSATLLSTTPGVSQALMSCFQTAFGQASFTAWGKELKGAYGMTFSAYIEQLSKDKVAAAMEAMSVREAFAACAAQAPHPASVDLSLEVGPAGRGELLAVTPEVDKDMFFCFQDATAKALFEAAGAKTKASYAMALPAYADPKTKKKAKSIKSAGWAMFALGAAMLVAGAGTGGSALSTNSDLDDDCPGGECSVDREGDVDRMYSMALATDVLLGLGGGVTLVGIILLGVGASKEKKNKAAPTANLSPTGLSLTWRY
ncbi:MAG: hypothetical protein ABIJ56_13405 [Pseudomonadota bacterium]